MTTSLFQLKRHGDAMSAVALTLGVPAFAGTTVWLVAMARK
jgi:hypothetical protein